MSSFEYAVGMELSWDGRQWRVINLGQSKVSLLDDQDGCRELPLSVFDELVKRGSLRILRRLRRCPGERRLLRLSGEPVQERYRKLRVAIKR